MKKSILYLTCDGLTDPLGQSQILPYLTGLAGKGNEITVLSLEKKNAFALYAKEIRFTLQKYNIRWIPIPYSTFPPLIAKLYDVLRMKRKALELCRRGDCRIVHCRSYIASLTGLVIKKRFNARFIFDMRGFWADEKTEGKQWNIHNPIFHILYRYFKEKEKIFFREADAVISLTEAGKKEIVRRSELRCDPERITVIPCCTDTALFNPHHYPENGMARLRTERGLAPDAFIISYLGSLGTWYMTDEMLLFFKRLRMRKEKAKFLFITPQSPEPIYHAAQKHHIPAEWLIIRTASREEVPAYLSLSNLSLFFIRPTFSKIASSPTKFAEALSMGVPVLCNAGIGDLDSIIEKTGCGLVVRAFHDGEYDRVLGELDGLLGRDKNFLRKVALKYFNLDDAIEKYHRIYTAS